MISSVRFLLKIICLSFLAYNSVVAQKVAPVDLVFPQLDAANSRWFFFNSATRPFGMVNLSPDNAINSDWKAGYQYHKDSIKCFSHIHGWQLSGIPVLPVTGTFKGHLGSTFYGSVFTHEKEVVKPGYHKVVLDSYKIKAELTSTTRVGFHKYTFPMSPESHILVDLATFLGPSDTESGKIKKNTATEIEGYAVMAATRRRPKPIKIYFVVQFDKPFESFNVWQSGTLLNETDFISGKKIGAYVSFKTDNEEIRKMKVGISYVSEAQAKLNIVTELPSWDFEKTVADSRQDWNNWLKRIEIKGGTKTEQRRFYTDLWHALQGRRIVSDVNGKYCDNTGLRTRIGQIPLDENSIPKFNHYNSDSFWGAQWTINTLWHLVYPEVTESFVNSMLLMYDDGGLIPRGPAGGNYTYVMTGASTTPFIVSAYLKGIKGFDIEKAYAGLRKNHMPGGMMSKAGYEHSTYKGGGLEFYIDRGYIPWPMSTINYGYHQDGTTQTLEYAYQDYALAQLALKLNKIDDYKLFIDRANNYKNVWNESLKEMWTKDLNGNWTQTVDILRWDKGFVEGNASQYTWFVPHDVQGLIELLEGSDKFSEKLNAAFEKALIHEFTIGKAHENGSSDDMKRIYINYGNQPSIQTAYLFNYAGKPWLTQYWSRQVIEKVYSNISPEFGYSGDEDQGLMGSLAVIMKMGLFSVNGGTASAPFYEIGSPLFKKITIHLNKNYYQGKKIIIEAKKNSNENFYIKTARWNNRTYKKNWISHDFLVQGGKLKLNMSNKPNEKWGSEKNKLPRSMTELK